MTDVYLNGVFVGDVESHADLVGQLKSERRRGKVSTNVNVFYDKILDEVRVESSRGRVRRPLIIVRDGQSLLTQAHTRQLEKKEIGWKDLVDQGIIEYIDAGEEENCLVSFTEDELTPDHTHLEISPIVMFGLCTALVPFGNHTASTRLSIGSKNQKQALGLYTSNYLLRMDMDVSILHTPNAPIVQTVMHDISNYKSHPYGQNVIVAVMSYQGYNMEDAIVLNKASVDCGFGRSSYYRNANAEELRYSGGLMDSISVPDKDVKGFKSDNDYRMLENDGIIFAEAKVKAEDVIIGKSSPPRFLSGMDEYNLASNVRRESSIALSHGKKGIIDFVLITENIEGNKLVQVRLRDQRIPEVGDKFTSIHGQKGVVGLIVPKADMPYTSKGITPDLIFSPHGIPSRMTISHLLELLASKTGSLAGRFVDGTTFASEKEKDLRQELMELGFNESGVETMYNGITGEILKARIYIGNMYYLKLKHMVANKLHSRALGPIQLLTRQPTEGRAKEGGLRLGEMEKDTFIAHGAALALKERFDSDKTVVPVCEGCGTIAIFDTFKDKKTCPLCGDNVDINEIEMSYAFKLILDEFKSLGIYPKLELMNKY